LHFERGGDNREVAQHGAAHQAHAGKQRDVGQALGAAGLHAAPVGQPEADHDGDGGAVHASHGQVAREFHGDQHHQAHQCKCGDQAIVAGGSFE